MEKKTKKTKIQMNEVDIIKILDTCYEKSLNGIKNVSPSIEELARDYTEKEDNTEKAIKSLIKNQIMKCTTSGFLTGFGGFITLPITLPTNITSVIYVQMRMIAAIAYLSGYDLKSDQVQSFVYACLAGISVNSIVKNTGIKLGNKLANSAISKIPGKTLTKINQKVGFRFITKFGQKGIINMGKLVPVLGAAISGGFDYAETKVIADRAYKMFYLGDFSVGIDEEKVGIIDNTKNKIIAIKDNAIKKLKK